MIDFDAFAEDVLDINVFGQNVSYASAAGQRKIIKVVFDNAFLSVGDLGEAGVASSSPYVTCKTSDVPDAARGDTVIISGTTWYVTEVQEDDPFTVLILSKDG